MQSSFAECSAADLKMLYKADILFQAVHIPAEYSAWNTSLKESNLNFQQNLADYSAKRMFCFIECSSKYVVSKTVLQNILPEKWVSEKVFLK